MSQLGSEAQPGVIDIMISIIHRAFEQFPSSDERHSDPRPAAAWEADPPPQRRCEVQNANNDVQYSSTLEPADPRSSSVCSTSFSFFSFFPLSFERARGNTSLYIRINSLRSEI
jgi:hypothetical protein